MGASGAGCGPANWVVFGPSASGRLGQQSALSARRSEGCRERETGQPAGNRQARLPPVALPACPSRKVRNRCDTTTYGLRPSRPIGYDATAQNPNREATMGIVSAIASLVVQPRPSLPFVTPMSPRRVREDRSNSEAGITASPSSSAQVTASLDSWTSWVRIPSPTSWRKRLRGLGSQATAPSVFHHTFSARWFHAPLASRVNRDERTGL